MSASATRTVRHRLNRLPQSVVVFLSVALGNALMVFAVSLLNTGVPGAAGTVTTNAHLIAAASLIPSLVASIVLWSMDGGRHG